MTAVRQFQAQLFGNELNRILDELNLSLVA